MSIVAICGLLKWNTTTSSTDELQQLFLLGSSPDIIVSTNCLCDLEEIDFA